MAPHPVSTRLPTLCIRRPTPCVYAAPTLCLRHSTLLTCVYAACCAVYVAVERLASSLLGAVLIYEGVTRLASIS